MLKIDNNKVCPKCSAYIYDNNYCANGHYVINTVIAREFDSVGKSVSDKWFLLIMLCWVLIICISALVAK